MKTLQITLFLIANVIFISQAGRDLHLLVFGAEASVLDQFDEEREKVRAERRLSTLVAEYRTTSEAIEKLEEGKNKTEREGLREQHAKLYEMKRELSSEIAEREVKNREIRDTVIFSVFGLLLIAGGGFLYRRVSVWPGFALVVTGFSILEYWASPSFSIGGAAAEYHQLLLCKTLLTGAALVALYVCWGLREVTVKPVGSVG